MVILFWMRKSRCLSVRTRLYLSYVFSPGELAVLSVASHSMIGTLLTVDEVAQWVVHAAQLPQEVADAFRSNRVTGYDFPGLIENQVWYTSLTMG